MNIISGTGKGILLLPVLGGFIYLILHFNGRANQQLKAYNTTSKQKLERKLLEVVAGIKHTRAFGRQNVTLAATFELINLCQRWYYTTLCQSGSVLFLCDLHTVVSLTLMVFLATFEPLASSPSGIGLSFWSSLCLSHALDCLARQLCDSEALLSDAKGLRELVQNIPVEDHESGVGLPPSWPDRGDVSFDQVTARYE